MKRTLLQPQLTQGHRCSDPLSLLTTDAHDCSKALEQVWEADEKSVSLLHVSGQSPSWLPSTQPWVKVRILSLFYRCWNSGSREVRLSPATRCPGSPSCMVSADNGRTRRYRFSALTVGETDPLGLTNGIGSLHHSTPMSLVPENQAAPLVFPSLGPLH